MTPTAATAPFLYVASDVPEGMTLAEWRRRRHAAAAHRSRVVVLVRRLRSSVS
jgi:hypothetical protein